MFTAVNILVRDEALSGVHSCELQPSRTYDAKGEGKACWFEGDGT